MAVQIFPLDVTEYDAAALGAWESTRTRGVYSAENEYAVTAAGGMALSVAAGRAWLKMNDFWGLNATNFEAVTLTVATPNGSLPRIDAVCLRIDKVANAPELLIKTGTPAASPAIPAITQGSTSYDEIYLATVYVGAGVTAITQANITDQRLNEKYCGLMRDGVTSIPTTTLQAQAAAKIAIIKEYEGNAKAQAAKAESILQAIQDIYTTYYEVRNPWTAVRESLQSVILRIYKEILQLKGLAPITVNDFDALNLTVADFDALSITVSDFDSNAKNIIGG